MNRLLHWCTADWLDYYSSPEVYHMVLTIPPGYAFGYLLSVNSSVSLSQSFRQQLYAVTVTNSISDLEMAAYSGN
jgi:hypothetical protein